MISNIIEFIFLSIFHVFSFRNETSDVQQQTTNKTITIHIFMRQKFATENLSSQLTQARPEVKYIMLVFLILLAGPDLPLEVSAIRSYIEQTFIINI